MKHFISGSTALLLSACLLAGCGSGSSSATDSSGAAQTTADSSASSAAASTSTTLSQVDNSKWQYNEDDKVYYQIGISYCANPADSNYETLAIFVPGGYMNATDNGDGTYSCELNADAKVGSYTASTAPILLPVDTPGYSAQAALTEYQSFTDYTNEGMIYVHAGCRGRDAGAPAGVTDLKAAIRYIRYNQGNIAGDSEKIFSFGMSGGGAQSALLGVTGDSDLYDDYLQAIGAVEGVSDAVYGSMAWCPITSLDSGDEAYEWCMGSTRSGLSDEEQRISDDLTAAYATYINSVGLTDENGNALTLEESDDGRYQAGSYYDYMKEVIETSLNNFLASTTFPYDADSSSQGEQPGMGSLPSGGTAPDGESMSGELPSGGAPSGTPSSGTTSDTSASGETSIADSMNNSANNDNISRTESSSGVSISGIYDTAQDYIDALNADGEWVTYDADSNTASISSISDFAKACKTASKSLGAFDQLDAGQGENTLFGFGDGNGAHFDQMLADILEQEGSDYADDYADDLAKTDSLGHSMADRVNMYSPLYYLLESQEGYKNSSVAKYFRIRTGCWQSDTSVTTEANLALALKNYGADVDFETVWGQGHTMAESSGSSTENFIAWINECCSAS